MRISLSLCFLWLLLASPAQYNSFIAIGIEDGLAQSQVNAVHQDASGYLWIATVSGLSRYDGSDIQNYYKADGLVDNLVTCITEHPDGTLYFGGLGGFTSFDGISFKPFPFPKNIVDSRVQYFQFSDDQTLWLGTSRDGYFKYSFEQDSFSQPNTDLGSNVHFIDMRKGLVAGNAGLYHDGQLIDPLLTEANVSDVAYEDEAIWVSTLGQGLYHYDGAWNHFTPEEYPYLAYVRDMLYTPEGRLWLAGPEGALRLSDQGWDVFNSDNGLSYTNLRHLDLDREGNIWISSNGQGLFRYTGEVFTSYKEGNPLNSDLMLSASERDGKIYLGMFDDSLQVIDETGQVYMQPDIMRTDIWAQLKDSHGRIWLGTSSGLYRSAAGERFERVLQDHLPSQRITALHEDNYGFVWVGHREGASVIYTDTEVYNYTSETGFEGKRIRAIKQAQDGAIWLGAQNGLFRVEEDWILQLGEEQGLNDNTIYSIQDDSYARLWVGAKNGLHILMSDSILQVVISGRVDANNINFLHASKSGYLYVGTNRGFFVAKVLEDVSAMDFRQYGLADGLPGLECNLNAVFESSTGDIWFGTNTGIVRFNEQLLISQPALSQPHLRMTDILLFAERFDLASRSTGRVSKSGLPHKLVMRPGENHLSFAFKGIRLKDPQGIRYQYYLEGVDQDWLPPSTSRSVTYSSLPFGDYRFKVRCVDASGEQMGEDLALDFQIQSPLYFRPWALMLEGILALGLIYLVLRWRRQVRDRKTSMVELSYRNRMQSLEQASLNSSMNRHFIFNSLNAIQFYINREDKRAANKYLSSFAKLIRKNLDSTTSDWVSLHDELERLELYLSLEHMRFEDKFSYVIDVASGMDTSAVRVPAMMLQPYVENSIWHGILPKQSPGQVMVSLSHQADRLRIRIEDDGIGIDYSRQSKSSTMPDHESKGMEITHHRLRLYGEMTGTAFEVVGPVQLESDGEVLGTRIDLFIPMV